MIAMLTTDAWASIQIDLDDGGGAQSWTLTAGETDAYSAAEAFVSWVDSTFGGSSSWTWSRNTSEGTAAIGVTLDAGPYDYTANAAAQSVLGVSASDSGVNDITWTSPLGTIAPDNPAAAVRSDNYHRAMRSVVPSSATGAVRASVPGLLARRPRIAWPGNEVDVERWRLTIASASNPRQAWVYSDDSGWLLMSIGAPSRSGSKRRYRLSAEVLS